MGRGSPRCISSTSTISCSSESARRCDALSVFEVSKVGCRARPLQSSLAPPKSFALENARAFLLEIRDALQVILAFIHFAPHILDALEHLRGDWLIVVQHPQLLLDHRHRERNFRGHLPCTDPSCLYGCKRGMMVVPWRHRRTKVCSGCRYDASGTNPKETSIQDWLLRRLLERKARG